MGMMEARSREHVRVSSLPHAVTNERSLAGPSTSVNAAGSVRWAFAAGDG